MIPSIVSPSPEGSPSPDDSIGSSESPEPGQSEPGLAECQAYAEEGLELLVTTFDLLMERTGLPAYKRLFREYNSMSVDCLDFLVKDSTRTPQKEACWAAGLKAGEVGGHLFAIDVEDGSETKHRREMFGALNEARHKWRECFPGEPVPNALQV